MSDWSVKAENGNERPVDSRSEAEEVKEEMEQLGMTVEIEAPKESDGGATDDSMPEEPIDVPRSVQNSGPEEPASDGSESGPLIADMNLSDDPLDVLPSYMITQVDGKPSLNKRGVSVLAYHFDIDVVDREVVAYPHETEYETAVVQFMVKGADGRKFSGMGEAHVDETPKHQLLRMAETRAYKRAVIFATGTGIVGYQELMDEL